MLFIILILYLFTGCYNGKMIGEIIAQKSKKELIDNGLSSNIARQ
jgi:hypothetical protein